MKRVEEATFGRVSGALHNGDFFRGQFAEFVSESKIVIAKCVQNTRARRALSTAFKPPHAARI